MKVLGKETGMREMQEIKTGRPYLLQAGSCLPSKLSSFIVLDVSVVAVSFDH